jgi:hypothetical protein
MILMEILLFIINYFADNKILAEVKHVYIWILISFVAFFQL